MSKSFEGQRKGEKVYDIVRRHVLVLARAMFIWLFLVAIALLLVFLFQGNANMYWVLLGAFTLGALVFFYYWIGWYFTVYIITSERIRLVTQKGLFGKSVIELPMNSVQNMSFSMTGAGSQTLKYGTIVLQTMVGDMVMDILYNPERIYNELQNILHAKKDEEDNV